MTVNEFDAKYYINLGEIMRAKGLALRKPKLKRKFVYDKDDGFVKIIGVETEW